MARYPFRKKADGIYEIIPGHETAVRTAIAVYIRHGRYVGVANQLNALGYQTVRKKEFNDKTVARMLKSVIEFGSQSKIVTDEVIDQITDIMQQQPCRKVKFVAAGKLFCARCSSLMKGSQKTQVYSCIGTCGAASKVSLEFVDTFIGEHLAKIIQGLSWPDFHFPTDLYNDPDIYRKRSLFKQHIDHVVFDQTNSSLKIHWKLP